MKMKNIYNIIAKTLTALAVVFSLNSCLEKLPTDYIPEEEAMQTFEDAEQTLTGIYAALKSRALYSGYLTLIPDIQTDLAYAVQGNTNTYGNFWLWNILPTTSEVESVYAALYTVIGRCNFYLDKVGDVRASLTDDSLIQYLDYYTGEVHCARALAYSELIKLYCKAYDPATADKELGVVLRSSYFNEEPTVRATLKESYEFVLADLAKAEELLDDDNDYYNAIYFTNAAAHAIHARVALYMQDWDGAIEHSSKVIDSGKFDLASAKNAYGNGTYLSYMWSNDASFEVIFKIGYTITSYGGALGSVFLNYTTDYTYYYPDYVPAQWVLQAYGSGDARYATYFTNLQTGYSHGLAWPLLTKYYGNESFMQSMIYHVNMPKPLRLAEQYLIRAEAYCNNNKFAAASADLTKLSQSRHTAGGNVNVTDKNWLDVISNERVKELYMEGFRLQDLKRWGRGFEREQQTLTQPEGSTMKIKADNPLFVWPIPKHELESPGSQILPNESNK